MSGAGTRRDYSLTGYEAELAEQRGLADAAWYKSPIARKELKELVKRSDGPAIRDTVIWLSALALSGAVGYFLWGSWRCIPFFAVYGVLYGSAADSRWHECGHGTAFKTRWLNDVIYNIACFMMLYEPVVWRWSHTRHHTDTIIVGRDPEITAPRPPDLKAMLLNLFGFKSGIRAFRKFWMHSFGKLDVEENTFVPESEESKVFWTARLYLTIFFGVAAWCAIAHSILPAMFIGLPRFYGAWLKTILGLTQHAGLDEDVLDHRLNSRTVYLNPVLRFLYWNMNYHVEHHMFPMVPYHALPRLHQAIKDDCPPAYQGLVSAYVEMIPALIRQVKDPTYFIHRELPRREESSLSSMGRDGMLTEGRQVWQNGAAKV